MLAQTTGKRITTRITEPVQEKLQAALEKAEQVIEIESTIVLTRRESLMLLEMIENPMPRNEKFLQAQSRYQQIKHDASSTA